MKFKYAFLTLLAGAALAFTGCVEEAPVNDPALAVNVEPSILMFDGKTPGSATVEVNATASWSVSGVPSWMTVTPPSGSAGKTSVTIAVEVGGEKARGAEVVFKAGNDSKILTVNQEGGTTWGTLENPYTCAKAIEFCATLADKAKGPKEVYVKGIITRIVEKYGTQYGNATFFMSDDGSADSPEFEVYRAYYFDNQKYDDVSKQNISVGDEVMVYGMIMNYGGQAETSQNEAYLYSLKAGTSPVLSGDVTSAELLADETEATFSVTAKNLKGKWTVTPKETYAWVTEYTKEGTESGNIVVKVAPNTAEEARTAEFSVAADGVTPVTLTLIQKGAKVVTTVAGITEQITSTDRNAPSAYAANLTGAVVSYVNGNNVYIEDASGAILLYLADHGLAAGKKISGALKGTGYIYNGLPEITSLGADVKVEDGGTIPETTMTVADLLKNYNANLSRRIRLADVTVKDAIADGDRNGVVTQGEAEINVYAGLNNQGLVMAEGAKGDLICYPTLYKETKQVSFWDNNDFASSTPSITADKDRVEIGPDATEAKFALTAKNLKKGWTVTPKETYDWVTEYTKEGLTSGDVVITVTPNPGEARTAEFTVATEGAAALTLTLVQKGAGMAPNIAGIAAQITSTSSSNPSSYKANLTEPAVVSYVNGNNVYIEDASGAILLYMKGHGLVPGVKLSGVMEGTGYLYNGLPEITAIGGEVKTEEGGEIPLTTLTVADLVANYQANLSRRIKRVGVTVKDAIADGDRNGVVTQNNAEINVYAGLNNKGLAMAEGAKGDLICYPTLFKETKQVSFWDNADWTVSGTPQPDGAIKTADELVAWFAAPTAEAKLGADINLAGKELAPVAEFAGTLDGQGHSIKGLSLKAPLFQVLTGTVKDLTLEGTVSATVEGDDSGVGHALATLANISKGTVTGCTNKTSVSLSGTGIVGSPVVAGLVAFQQGGTFKGNKNLGSVTLTTGGTANAAIEGFNRKPFSVAAGVVGVLVGATAEDCVNEGAVKVGCTAVKNVGARHYVGGVVGTPEDARVINCTNRGAISADFTDPDKNAAKQVWVGGVIGGRNGDVKTVDGAYVEGCKNYGECTLVAENSVNNYLGGIAGQATVEATGSNYTADQSTIQKLVNCHNYGKLVKKGAGGCRLGGIHGGAATLDNCVNEGAITVEGISTAGAVGGLVGYPTQIYHPVTGSKNLGNITVTCDVEFAVGGLFGQGGNTNQTYAGNAVNCTITAPASVNAGIIVGTAKTLKGKTITYGTAEAPIKVKGSVKGTTLSAGNFTQFLVGDGGVTAEGGVIDTTNVQYGE